MIHKLTDKVWFGDANAPKEAGDSVKAIINVAHVIRGPRFCSDINAISRHAVYFRLPKKDREQWDGNYFEALLDIMELVATREWFPVLTHCQFGGHRGPSAGICMAWALSDRKLSTLNSLHDETWRLTGRSPATHGGRGLYYLQMMENLRKRSSR